MRLQVDVILVMTISFGRIDMYKCINDEKHIIVCVLLMLAMSFDASKHFWEKNAEKNKIFECKLMS